MGESHLQLTCRQQRVSIILLIISFLLLGVSLIITWLNPAVTYEVSIFLSTPKIYWVSLLFSLFIGFFIVIKFNLSDENRIYKNSALLLLFIAFASFLALWIIRGYYLWCSGDPLTHLGKIKDILLTGYIEKDNIYPITHIFVAQICDIFNINPIIPHKYLPLYFGLLYLVFMCLFAKVIFSDKKKAMFGLLVAIIPMGGWFLNLTPNHLANLTLPLAFFLVFKNIDNKKYEWSILLLFMCFFITIFHPVPSLALLLILLALSPPILTFMERITNRFHKHNPNFEKMSSMVVAIILFVWFTTWVSSFYVWDHTIKNIYTLLTEGAPTKLDALVADAVYAHSYGYSVIEQFLKVYGGLCIYLLLTAIGFILLWKKVKQNKVSLTDQKLIMLSIPLTLIITFMGLLYFINIDLFGPGRLEIYVIMLSTIVVGYVLFEYIKSGPGLKRETCVSLFLVILFVIAGSNIYPSRYILGANWQITRTEVNGMDLLLHSKGKLPITSLSIAPKRYADAILTKDERSKLKVSWKVPDELKIPFHFGYDEGINLGDHYDEDIYMVLTSRDRTLYKEVFPEIEHLRFTDDDFAEVENDNTITKFYANGGFDSYYICSYQDAITS
jgi:hypothetical protein